MYWKWSRVAKTEDKKKSSERGSKNSSDGLATYVKTKIGFNKK